MDPSDQRSNRKPDDLLTDLVDELVDRAKVGETIDLESYRSRISGDANLLDDAYDALVAVLGLRDAAAAPSLPAPHSHISQLCGTTLGSYRLLHELGRGGMGIVFEAEHVTSSQRVAVKVLSANSLLSGTHLERFKNESRAAAMLRHPHVVKIHETGHEQGLQYYVMDLMESGTLADLLDNLRHVRSTLSSDRTDFPSSADPISQWTLLHNHQRVEYYRAIAKLSLRIAEALHDAHENGVIHRDVKPSNLLLDRDGKPYIGDFGMAHIHGDPSLTQTGDRLGTLRYMSPEQARGNALVDHRTDIYSLGATMYELLSLRPALDTDDRATLLAHVIHKEPLSLRRLAQDIPFDLVRIVHQAMAKSSAERYDSARAMAADLTRFLQGEPVLARRSHTIRQLRRWMDQHRTVTALAAFSTFLVLLLSTAGPIAAWRYHKLAEAEVAARHSSEEAQRRLQTLIKDSLIEATEALENTPGIDAIHRDLIDAIEHQVNGLLARADLDERSRIEAAGILVRLGYIQNLRFDARRVEPMVQEAMDILTPIASDSCSDANLYRILADGWFLLAIRRDESEAMRKSVEYAETAVRLDPTNPANPTSLGWSQQYLGELLVYERRFEVAEREIRAGIETFRRLSEAYPDNGEYATGAVNGRLFLATLHEESGNLESSVQFVEQAFELLKPIEDYARKTTRKRAGVAGGYVALARLHNFHRRFTEAQIALDQAESWLEPLEAGFPNCRWAKNVQQESFRQLGDSLMAQGKPTDAIAAYQRSLSVAEPLDVAKSSAVATRWRLALAYWNAGDPLRFRVESDKALEAATRQHLHQVLAAIYVESPDRRLHHVTKGLEAAKVVAERNEDLRYLIALAYLRGHRWHDAARYLQHLQHTRGYLSAAENLCLAKSLMELGNYSEAMQAYRMGLAMVSKPCRIEPDRLDALAGEMKNFLNLEEFASPLSLSYE